MNIVYIGTGNFGLPCLEKLVKKGYMVSCVVSSPDKPKNRGMHVKPSAIKEKALDLGLGVYQPDDINSGESVGFLRGLKADLFVVVAYGQKLSQPVLDIPGIMPINIHASLLPAYRGAAPINRAIMRGEKTTGVTLMKITLRMDAGPIILQRAVDILDSDTSETLSEKLSLVASDVLIEGICLIGRNEYSLTPQDESKATYAQKLKKSDGYIDWLKPAGGIVNQIRGCQPWPGATTKYKGRVIKICSASVLPGMTSVNKHPGSIIGLSHEGIIVAARSGGVMITSLQLQGKRIIKASEFISGYRPVPGDVFG